MAFSTVGVIGLGTMGAGIAEVVARTGRRVVAVEVDEAAAARGRSHIEHSTERAVAGDKLTAAERTELLGRIEYHTRLAALAGCELVIEAIPEQLAGKAEVFAEVDSIVRPDVVLASNTSSLSVTEIGVHTGRPGKVVGLHFFNPAPIMPLVEVVRAVQTSEATVAALTAFAERIGKSPITVHDRPGFLVNRLLMPYLNDVIQAYDDGLASADDIDTALELGLGYPMGPLKLLDLIGLDVHEHATEAAYAATRNPTLSAPPLLRRLVEAGRLGHKTGQGFRDHTEEETA